MGMPVVMVAAGGLPVVESSNGFGAPITVATNGYGVAVTKVVGMPGLPVVFATGLGLVSDPNFSNVKLLMGFNGANGSQIFTDESPSARGAASFNINTLSTAQFKFGTASMRNPGTGVITYPDSADWVLASSNSDQYTVECWVRLNSTGINRILMAQYTIDGTVAWSLQTTGSSASEFTFLTSPSGTFATMVGPASTTAALTTGVWYHLAADKDATGKIRIYKDGVMVGSQTPANSSVYDSGQLLGISCGPTGAGPTDGWFDEVRITKGVARYASDAGFAVPAAAFPRQ